MEPELTNAQKAALNQRWNNKLTEVDLLTEVSVGSAIGCIPELLSRIANARIERNTALADLRRCIEVLEESYRVLATGSYHAAPIVGTIRALLAELRHDT